MPAPFLTVSEGPADLVGTIGMRPILRTATDTAAPAPAPTPALVPIREVVHIPGRAALRGRRLPHSDRVAAKDELGRRGEQLAAEHLQTRAGLTVLSRNWRCAEGELDIVATDAAAETVVFCEVKTRSGVGYGTPFEAVTQGKRRKLRRLGLLWLSENRIRSFPTMRFDVVGVLLPPDGPPVVEHRPQAF